VQVLAPHAYCNVQYIFECRIATSGSGNFAAAHEVSKSMTGTGVECFRSLSDCATYLEGKQENGQKRTRGEARNGKLRSVAADLFLKRDYDGVTIDRVVRLAGGSKSTVYSEFGGKCGLFISSIETLCCESNEPLTRIDYTGSIWNTV
jgi:hypothetical protein